MSNQKEILEAKLAIWLTRLEDAENIQPILDEMRLYMSVCGFEVTQGNMTLEEMLMFLFMCINSMA